jgi:hypothetical protein
MNIEVSGSTYVITTAENVIGAGAGRYCDVRMDNWKVESTITSSDTLGYKLFDIGGESPWIKYKVELRGSETTIEELTIIKEANKKNE